MIKSTDDTVDMTTGIKSSAEQNEEQITREDNALNVSDAHENTYASTSVKVTVIIPIYNACDYIRPALDSVLDQTFSEFEIICVDDGSTDRSLDIIKEYQKRDGRVRIVTETNAGPGLARNNGLRRARGEYVVFLDADDFFEPTLIEDMYTEAKEKDLDIVIAEYDIYNSKKAMFRANAESSHGSIYEGGRVTSKNEYPNVILQSNTGSAWNKMFRKSFLSEKQITFLEEVKMFEDVYFTVCALAFAERVGKIDKILMHHRVYSEQSRARLFKRYFAQVPAVYERIKAFLMRGGMYEPLANGFLNLSVSRCYTIYSMLTSDEREQFWDMLHERYVDALGWTDREAGEFEKSEYCSFCANIQLYNYAQYAKRTSKGLKLRLDRLAQKFKQSKRWNKFKAFFVKKKKENK